MTRAARTRPHDPRRIDVPAFAAEAAELAGTWPLSTLQRLAEAGAPGAAETDTQGVTWQARGEVLAAVGRPPQTWLHLSARARPQLTCQRCLQPVACEIALDTSIRFVPDETTAERLDAEFDYDVLASDRPLDLRELIEDELLLALPLVPRHDACPEPLAADPAQALPAQADDHDAPAEHPFAALAALKPGRKG
jgi:uncharacterized protein